MKTKTITIPEREYKHLKTKARAYEKLASQVNKFRLDDKVDEVVADFKKTDLYTDGFIKDLGSGLRKSSYAKHKR